MLLRFEEIREAYNHSGNKGSNAEQIVRDFLRQFLPPSYRIGHGEVIDQNGGCSKQIDIVITNEHQPFLNDLSVPSVFIIEGVSCAAEVKSVLTVAELEKALANSLAFKKLNVGIQKGMQVQGILEDIQRFVTKRPFFLFAFESQIAQVTLKRKIEEWNVLHDLPVSEQIDAVFILDGESLVNHGEGKGAFRFITTTGEFLGGYQYSPVSINPPLVSLLSWLSSALMKFTLPASPILNYLIKDAATIMQEQQNQKPNNKATQ